MVSGNIRWEVLGAEFCTGLSGGCDMCVFDLWGLCSGGLAWEERRGYDGGLGGEVDICMRAELSEV